MLKQLFLVSVVFTYFVVVLSGNEPHRLYVPCLLGIVCEKGLDHEDAKNVLNCFNHLGKAGKNYFLDFFSKKYSQKYETPAAALGNICPRDSDEIIKDFRDFLVAETKLRNGTKNSQAGKDIAEFQDCVRPDVRFCISSIQIFIHAIGSLEGRPPQFIDKTDYYT